ncbi:MAG: Two component regulator propeller [Bacteroidetes bacterium OLB11]|nr:MAG: Two component regulator propeller [Bacteroidetes bacterium OLB11]
MKSNFLCLITLCIERKFEFMRTPFFIFFLLICIFTKAQEVPVGSWQSHFAYNTATTVELVGDKVFSASEHLRSYSILSGEFESYSKVNGLSDVGISIIRYDPATDYLVIIYNSGNIDLMQGLNFYNIPDIKNLNLTGSKKINSLYFKNKLIYLSTDFGIIVLDPIKKEIKETYVLQDNTQTLNINSLTSYNGFFYAATSAGIFKADENNPSLQNFANWVPINHQAFKFIFSHHQQLYSCTTDSLYLIQNDQLHFIYNSEVPILNVRTGENDFYLCESDNQIRKISIFNENAQLIDSTKSINPRDLVEVAPNQIWEADYWEGLIRLDNRHDKVIIKPNAVYSNSCYNLKIQNNDLYVLAGGENSWIYTYNGDGFSKYNLHDWTVYNRDVGTPAMDTIYDIMDLVVDPKTKNIYAASFISGLLEINPANNTSIVYKDNGYIQSTIGDPNAYRIAALQYDDNQNLWMTNYGAPDQLVVKKADGTWQKFAFPYAVSEKSASQLTIDNNNQKWVVAPRGIGIFVLNDNNTIDNKNDDKVKLIQTGIGYGNLPSNEVNCITKDLNGKLWVGTSDGIGIINCPESVMNTGGCDAELKIVKYDLNAGLLFQRENVKTICADGANNKWIGTNNGIWLISDDAEKIIYHFNEKNSPLPSNEINKIVVHPQTGDVFIATNKGLVSFRGQATEGNETNNDLLVFPNPVPSEYNGTIAIKGLVTNADVRITDVAGQLVYRTKAQGGQATWQGVNYLGKSLKPVYIIFLLSNADGSEKKAGKFIFNQ